MKQYFRLNLSEDTEIVITVGSKGTLSLIVEAGSPQPIVRFANVTEPNHYRRDIVAPFFLKRVDN